MKRFVQAGIISAIACAALAAITASCTWTTVSKEQENKTEEPDIVPEDLCSIAEVLQGKFVGDTVWVQGYVVGGLTEAGSIDFVCDTTLAGTALVLAEQPDCQDPGLCVLVRLTKAAHKEALGLDNPANRPNVLHHRITLQGKVTLYKKLPALANICQYKLE